MPALSPGQRFLVTIGDQPLTRGQITPSAGSAQVTGAASSTDAVWLAPASFAAVGEVFSIAPMISAQTLIQAMNSPLNMMVSNFMMYLQ
jgi:hypothetical protein